MNAVACPIGLGGAAAGRGLSRRGLGAQLRSTPLAALAPAGSSRKCTSAAGLRRAQVVTGARATNSGFGPVRSEHPRPKCQPGLHCLDVGVTPDGSNQNRCGACKLLCISVSPSGPAGSERSRCLCNMSQLPRTATLARPTSRRARARWGNFLPRSDKPGATTSMHMSGGASCLR